MAFPVAVDSFTTKVNNVDIIDASHVNNLQTAVVNIENTLFQGMSSLFINGGFDIWQRTTNDTGVTTTRKYVSDRWAVKTGAGTLANVQRSTTVRSGARSKYSHELVGASGVTTVNIDQRIESLMSGRYKRTLYFNGYIHNGSGASFTPKIYVSTPSAADNWASSTVRNGGGSGENLQSCANASWTLVSWTADVSGYTDINNGLEIRVEIPSGSLVASDTVRLAEFNLATLAQMPFVQLSAQEELTNCQRYYNVLGIGGAGFWASATQADLQIIFPVEMRATPTATLTTTTPTIDEPGVASRTASGATITNVYTSAKGVSIRINGFTSATAGNPAVAQANNYIFTAEL